MAPNLYLYPVPDKRETPTRVEILAPGVEHRQEANLGGQMLGVGGDLQQGLGGSAKEDPVDFSRILKGQVGDLLWQRKHHVEIGVYGQQFGFPWQRRATAHER
jgi:hypothetical protein